MDQDSEAGFVPKPFDDILRDDDDAPKREPAGRPEPVEARPEPVETGETAAPAEDKPKADQPRDEAGRFAPKEAAEAPQQTGTPPAPQNAPPQSVPTSALLEERRKRQALEAQLREMQARMAPAQPAAPPQPEVAPEDLLFQDPRQFVQTLRAQQEEALLATRLETSAAIARQQPDYAEAEAALAAYAQSSPAAAQEVARALRSHPAPAMWAYEVGKRLMAQTKWAPVMQQHADPDAWINAEVERRLAERAAQQPAPSSAPPPPPASLAGVRSAAPRAQWAGPRPTNAIFGAKRV